MNVTEPAALGPMPGGDRERLEYAAKKLEGLWLSHILKEGRGSGSNMFESSMASKMFREMFDEALADKMAERGLTGLSKAMVDRLLPEKISTSTVSGK